MKPAVKVGLWIMIAAVISAFITAPLGYGKASGIAFAGGMVLAWVGGLLFAGQWLACRFRQARRGG